ncbi:hypothetical protein McpCs1_18850 [Methanocorpusculaceae archaeon Cs1]|uniref:Uncharacterized protein n=1 Tax=Methanorbis rubei TaxID=3028300 RepID=A0AAE4SC60_9EURY|nr:hypothetical protein [Methanocorpusculaceae archaeon Cs1]
MSAGRAADVLWHGDNFFLIFLKRAVKMAMFRTFESNVRVHTSHLMYVGGDVGSSIMLLYPVIWV